MTSRCLALVMLTGYLVCLLVMLVLVLPALRLVWTTTFGATAVGVLIFALSSVIEGVERESWKNADRVSLAFFLVLVTLAAVLVVEKAWLMPAVIFAAFGWMAAAEYVRSFWGPFSYLSVEEENAR